MTRVPFVRYGTSDGTFSVVRSAGRAPSAESPENHPFLACPALCPPCGRHTGAASAGAHAAPQTRGTPGHSGTITLYAPLSEPVDRVALPQFVDKGFTASRYRVPNRALPRIHRGSIGGAA